MWSRHLIAQDAIYPVLHIVDHPFKASKLVVPELAPIEKKRNSIVRGFRTSTGWYPGRSPARCEALHMCLVQQQHEHQDGDLKLEQDGRAG